MTWQITNLYSPYPRSSTWKGRVPQGRKIWWDIGTSVYRSSFEKSCQVQLPVKIPARTPARSKLCKKSCQPLTAQLFICQLWENPWRLHIVKTLIQIITWIINSQEERSRYEALALISEQDDPEMALDLLLGLVLAIIFSYQQIHASHRSFTKNFRYLKWRYWTL